MKTIKELLCMTQDQAYDTVKEYKHLFNDLVMDSDGSYLVMGMSEEKKKPMLCVHLDTINTARGLDVPLNPKWFGYDRQVGKIYCKDTVNLKCLGGDDRAGLWIALRLMANPDIRDKYIFGFFFDEEVGGNGSSQFAKDYKDYEDYVNCFIGLDRRGVDEVATYGSDNEDLIAICNDLGYKTEMGSFTDASNLSKSVACVNLSVGYDYEHSTKEVLYTAGMVGTLKILEDNVDKFDRLFEVEYSSYSYGWDDMYPYNSYNKNSLPDPVLCDCCGTHAPLYESGNYFVCSECIDVFRFEDERF